MISKLSIEKDLSNLANKKGWTRSIVDKAIEAFDSGRLGLDLSRDYYTKNELGEKLKKIHDCADLLEIREYDDGTKAIHNGNFCRCPVVCITCADKVSRRRKAFWKPRIQQAARRFQYIYMLTMTIKDGAAIEERLNTLIRSKKRFRLFGQRRGDKKDCGEWSKVEGALSSTEIVWGSGSGLVHAHEHALLFTNERLDYKLYCPLLKSMVMEDNGLHQEGKWVYKGSERLTKTEYSALFSPIALDVFTDSDGLCIPVSKLSREWIRATREQGYNIDVSPLSYRDFKRNPEVKGKRCNDFAEWVAAQAAEVLKYNSKLAEGLHKNPVTPQQYVELIQRRGARRLFNSYGAFRNRRDSLYFSPEEERWLDYVEWRDAQSYTIKRSEYRKDNYKVSSAAENRAVFVSSDKPDRVRRFKLHCQGEIVGWFRRVKAAALADRSIMMKNTMAKGAADTEEWKRNIEEFIDKSKEAMRMRLKKLWMERYPDGACPGWAPAPF